MSTATFGIDLASQPKKTAACLIEWDGRGGGEVQFLRSGLGDTELLAEMTRSGYVTRVGIDSPFGWPRDFLESISGYQRDGRWPDAPDTSDAQQRMRLRATDRAVHKLTQITPLSVSTDRIGVVAMRCARLLAAYWQSVNEPADRSGAGRVLEVYPAAALRHWGIALVDEDDPGSYEGKDPAASSRRQRLLARLTETTSPWLKLPDTARDACVTNDDCLDALISALVARAAERILVEPVTDLDAARQEGWIHIPKPDSLHALGG
jgi:Protein of unknown function (DUF429)